MSPVDFWSLSAAKMDWLDRRQAVLSQNIANVDTPGYRARDLPPFPSMIANAAPPLERTNPLHLASLHLEPDARPEHTTARAPDGNAVDLDRTLTEVADTETNSALVDGLWKSYMGMFMTALGRGG